jgi:hypothetical protein
MLDDDVVNIIRLRNMPTAARLSAPKWRRAADIVSWILNEMPAGAQYQVYGFNTAAAPLLAGSAGQWLAVDDDAQRGKVLEALGTLTPADGTSLVNALKPIREMQSPPEQVVLITDGLPTRGASPPALRRTIDASGRVKLFDEAVRGINRSSADRTLRAVTHERGRAGRASLLGAGPVSPRARSSCPSPDWP